jgi:hypothetical protein
MHAPSYHCAANDGTADIHICRVFPQSGDDKLAANATNESIIEESIMVE